MEAQLIEALSMTVRFMLFMGFAYIVGVMAGLTNVDDPD